jgi:isoleucyl-tRNA synthetase
MNEYQQQGLLNQELGLAVVVEASPHSKCARCWHRREDIGQDSAHPELCQRCVANINGHPEQRRFA